MKLKDYKMIFFAVALTGVLLIAAFSYSNLYRPSSSDPFSQLSLLDAAHAAKNFPFNLQVGNSYSAYVGVTNHMGNSMYYVLYVKLANKMDQLPNPETATTSPLEPLYEYRFTLQDGKNWENLMKFSVKSASISGNQSSIQTLSINDDSITVNKASVWDSNATIYYYKLFFELWAYNSQSTAITYNNRCVYLLLNITQTSG